MGGEARDTQFGYLRRTGPTTVELLDKETGRAYAINYAAIPWISPESPRHYVDELFLPPASSDTEGVG